MNTKAGVYSVGQVNAYIRNMFTQDFLLRSILVRGEVSNCKYHTSGHIYFTLKDTSGTLSCVMFAGRRRGLSFSMREGDQVIVHGTVDVYERDGRYQLYAQEIMPDGGGILAARFEALKKKLEESGMFDEAYKQPVPKYIKTLGVVTAPTGAAVRDIIQIAKRRNPYVQVILYPAIVQGDEAVPSIIRGIKALAEYGVDVMIIGRGGGSAEDLWAFNEEAVAQAVFDCPVPVISAVGHETDTVITDYVADLRAPTPSAAAELAVFDAALLKADIAAYERALTAAMNSRIRRAADILSGLRQVIKSYSPGLRLRDGRMRLISLQDRLDAFMDTAVSDRRHRLEMLAGEISHLSPLARLKGGYSYIADERGRAIRSVRDTFKGDLLDIRMKDGAVKARVTEITETADITEMQEKE